MTHEILFGWTAKVVEPSRSVIRSESRSHILHSNFIPRIGETVDLGYVDVYSQYVEKKVKDVRYVFNTNYVYIELE